MAVNNPNPFLQGGTKPTTKAQSVTPNTIIPPTNTAPLPGGQADDLFEIDLQEVQSNFIIPNDVYPVRCIEVEQSVSKAGNPMYVWTFTIINGEYAGRDFKSYTAVTPAAMWKVAETVIALGVGQVGQVVTFRRSEVINRECFALIEEQEDNQKNMRSQISKLFHPNDVTGMSKNA